jgi:hypothetical protein
MSLSDSGQRCWSVYPECTVGRGSCYTQLESGNLKGGGGGGCYMIMLLELPGSTQLFDGVGEGHAQLLLNGPWRRRRGWSCVGGIPCVCEREREDRGIQWLGHT